MGRTLHIGCGPNSKEGDVGIDILAGPAVDHVHDLNVTPWPVGDSEFDAVIAVDVLEHLDNIPPVMAELYRVCCDGATIRVQVPSSTSPDVAIDSTHRRGFSYQTFEYFDSTKPLYRFGYLPGVDIRIDKARFVSLRGDDGPPGLRRPDRLVERVANRWPIEYEARLCHIWPMRALKFELRVVKPA